MNVPRMLLAMSLAMLCPGKAPAHPHHHPAPLADCCGAAAPELLAGPLRAEARLSVTIVDAKTGRPTPARVRILTESGEALGLVGAPAAPTPNLTERLLAEPGSVLGLPVQAIGVMRGRSDVAEGYALQENGAFFVDGFFDLPMPAGKFTLIISKGFEFSREVHSLKLEPGDHLTRQYGLRRWIDMPERGWYSSDAHVHLRRSPRENPAIRAMIAAEDVHVGVLLQMGDFWTTYYSQYAWGRRGVYGGGNYFLTSGQEEPRTRELGHTISFGAEAFVRFTGDYYSYDRVFDRVHELGGVSGYAHRGVMFEAHRGMTLDVLEGKADFLELVQFCGLLPGPLAVEHYYRFLDLGFKLTAVAGSDFPWCSRKVPPGIEETGGQIGHVRFYTYTDGPLTFDSWMKGVKAGRTFATSGPMLELRVNGHLPGTQLDVKPGTKLRVTARAYGCSGQIPLERLQIIGHGKVLSEAVPGASGQAESELSAELELTPEHGIWIAARADGGVANVAHTTPVYVTVNGDGFHNRAKLEEQIAIARSHLQEVRDLLKYEPALGERRSLYQMNPPPSWYRGSIPRLERRVANCERILEELRQKK